MKCSHIRQQEAELIALQYQKDIAELRKQGEGKAIAILRDAIKIKNPTIRKLKTAIRQYLTKISSSSDSRLASRNTDDITSVHYYSD